MIRADGHGTVELLEAILQFLPLDQYVEKPVALMKVVDGDPCKPTIWDLGSNQLINEAINIFLYCAFQTLEIDGLIRAVIKGFLNERGLSNPPLAVDHHSFADVVLLQEHQFFLTAYKHIAPPIILNA